MELVGRSEIPARKLPKLMKFSRLLRLSNSSSAAFVGAGGKTSALFLAAAEFGTSFVTTTTHIGDWQIAQADHHTIIHKKDEVPGIPSWTGIGLFTGSLEGNRFGGIDPSILSWLRAKEGLQGIPFLIEADGARMHPLKAPADHEPVIPDFVDTVIVVAGLSGLGKDLTEEFVHRHEIFSQLGNIQPGSVITTDVLVRVLTHPSGGLKGIPGHARRIVLLNQADTEELHSKAKMMTSDLLVSYDGVLVSSLHDPTSDHSEDNRFSLHEPVAGIILAGGQARRFGQPKQLIEYQGEPLIRRIARIAILAGLSPVIVVTGAYGEQVEAALTDIPVICIRNEKWQDGQSTSIQAGLSRLSPLKHPPGAAIFLLADQPFVSPTLLRALVDKHSNEFHPIVAPEVLGQRANPVLFDRDLFPELMQISGDVGGRAIISKHTVGYVPWNDASTLVDVDTPDDMGKME